VDVTTAGAEDETEIVTTWVDVTTAGADGEDTTGLGEGKTKEKDGALGEEIGEKLNDGIGAGDGLGVEQELTKTVLVEVVDRVSEVVAVLMTDARVDVTVTVVAGRGAAVVVARTEEVRV
jgi:hypothetical protein